MITYAYRVYDSTFQVMVKYDTRVPFTMDPSNYPHYALYRSVLQYLGANGFFVTKDKEIKRDYPCLSPRHDQGNIVVIPDNGCLQFRSEITAAGFTIKFYQNMVQENPNGNYYDFNIREMMPYPIKLAFCNTVHKLEEYLRFINAEDQTERKPKEAEERIKLNYARSWHHPQNDMNFDLSDTRCEEIPSYNCRDRDGKTIRNGDVKYCYGHDGHLRRVTVYHDINNMWWCIVAHDDLQLMASFELFDCEHPANELRRKAPDRAPAAYKTMCLELSKMSDKTLERELRRRRRARRK